MITTIGKGITITGSIQAGEPVTIAGTVNGDVLASDYDVTVEAGARVEARSPHAGSPFAADRRDG